MRLYDDNFNVISVQKCWRALIIVVLSNVFFRLKINLNRFPSWILDICTKIYMFYQKIYQQQPSLIIGPISCDQIEVMNIL